MGLFSKMFNQPLAQSEKSSQRYEELIGRYRSALNAADDLGIHFESVYLDNDKLFIRGTAPNQGARASFLAEFRAVSPDAEDIKADISVGSCNSPGDDCNNEPLLITSYIVRSGDTLSKISKEFYGRSEGYLRIFYANRDKLDDPFSIEVGQQLTIPRDDE